MCINENIANYEISRGIYSNLKEIGYHIGLEMEVQHWAITMNVFPIKKLIAKCYLDVLMGLLNDMLKLDLSSFNKK
jgi:hypothetical protein